LNKEADRSFCITPRYWLSPNTVKGSPNLSMALNQLPLYTSCESTGFYISGATCIEAARTILHSTPRYCCSYLWN